MSRQSRRARFYYRRRIERNPLLLLREFLAWEGWDRVW